MSELMDMIVAESVMPVKEPLEKAKDELAAELLATVGTASGAARASDGKITAQTIYRLANGYASVGQKRAAAFRGRVKYKIIEMQQELRQRRLSLARKAAATYDDLMDEDTKKKRPEVAAQVAKDTLHGVGFFGDKDQGGAVEAPQLSGDQLAALAERTLQRRKKRTGEKVKKTEKKRRTR